MALFCNVNIDCIVYLFGLLRPTTEHLDAGVLFPSIIRAAAVPPSGAAPRPATNHQGTIRTAPSHTAVQRCSAEAQQIEQWDAGMPHPGTTRAATALLTGQC